MKGLLFLVFISPITLSAQLVGKVVSIADGDTFTLLVQKTQYKIRLHGIDCPEKKQDYGEAARQFLDLMIAGDSVSVDELGKDRYGRTLGIVYVGNINVNEALLQKGLAWHYKNYDKNPAWAQLEASARLARINIWSMPNPTPPWEWRRQSRH